MKWCPITSKQARPNRQHTIWGRRLAVLALFAALAAGLVEMVAQLWPLDSLGADRGPITVRLFIYTAVAVLIVLFARGRNWARMILLVGLGIIGTASLVIEPLIWLFDEPDFDGLSAGLVFPGGVIIVSRIAHIAAVGVGVMAMLKLRPFGRERKTVAKPSNHA